MRHLAVLLVFAPLASRADPSDCVSPADRVAQVAVTCAADRSLDCVPDLVLAVRMGTQAEASRAADLLAKQRGATLAQGWALASPRVSQEAADRVGAALRAACEGGDPTACVVRAEAVARRSGAKAEATATTGYVPSEEVGAFVRRYVRLAQRCYERRLACDPKARGTVRLDARIGAGGLLAGLELKSGVSDDVDACVLAVVSRWRFPAPRDGGEARTTLPFVFASGT